MLISPFKICLPFIVALFILQLIDEIGHRNGTNTIWKWFFG
jgi:hypothetical protein